MKKHLFFSAVIFLTFSISITTIFCPPKEKTSPAKGMFHSPIEGLHKLLQDLKPTIILEPEENRKLYRELNECISAITFTDLGLFKIEYAPYLFKSSEKNYFDQDPFTLGYLFGHKALKNESLIKKQRAHAVRAIQLIHFLRSSFDKTNPNLSRKFLAFISGFQYCCHSLTSMSEIPSLLSMPNQNDSTYIAFAAGMDSTEANCSPRTITDHAFNCGFYIQDHINKTYSTTLVARLPEKAVVTDSDDTAADLRISISFQSAKTTNESYLDGFLLEHSLSFIPNKEDFIKTMFDTKLAFFTSEVRRLESIPNQPRGPLFQTYGSLEFLNLKNRFLLTLTISELDNSIINQSFLNGYNTTHENLFRYLKYNFEEEKEILSNLRNLSMRAYIAGAILKMIINAYLKHNADPRYISVEEFIDKKDLFMAAIFELERKVPTKAAECSRTSEDADQAAKELLEELDAEMLAAQTKLKQKKWKRAQKKSEKQALSAKKVLEDAEPKTSQKETKPSKPKNKDKRRAAPEAAAGVAAAPATAQVDLQAKPSDKELEIAPVTHVRQASPEQNTTRRELVASLTESVSAVAESYRQIQEAADTADFLIGSPPSTTSEISSASISTHSSGSEAPHTPREKGIYECKHLCTIYPLEYLLYQAQWHVNYYQAWITIPNSVLNLEYWQARLDTVNEAFSEKNTAHQKAIKDAYLTGLSAGENAFDESVLEYLKAIQHKLDEHFTKKTDEPSWYIDWIYLKGCQNGYESKDLRLKNITTTS
jgi:hypothetical protein